MAKLTLLQMTQSILNSMSSDEVNSISDSTESLQIANIIQDKYYDIQTRSNLPDDNQPFQLLASGDITKPTVMEVPAGVSRINWIKYYDANPADGTSLQNSQFGAYSHDVNTDIPFTAPWVTSSTTSITIGLGNKTFTVPAGLTVGIAGSPMFAVSGINSMLGTLVSYSGTTLVMNVTSVIGTGTYASWLLGSNATGSAPPGYQYVTILPFDQFMDMINAFNVTESNVLTYTFSVGGSSYTFNYKNNIQPHYCTVLSNQYVLFDTYDMFFDSTLQTSKTFCMGLVVPPFELTDSFIPTLDDNQFPLLLNEAKALAFYELKQMPHAKAEQEIKRQLSTMQKNKSMVNRPTYFNELPDFGRRPNTGGYSGRPMVRLRG